MKNVIMFTVGAACGSLLTWKLIEKKYKDLAEEEIDSVREMYKNKNESNISFQISEKEDVKKKEEITNDNVEESSNGTIAYNNIVENLGYSTDDDDYTVKVDNGPDVVKPYIISSDEFGNVDGYDAVSWTYYEDGILTDEMDQIVGDPKSIIGDALSHFGDEDDDSIFVRNEETQCDYEILKVEIYFNGIDS